MKFIFLDSIPTYHDQTIKPFFWDEDWNMKSSFYYLTLVYITRPFLYTMTKQAHVSLWLSAKIVI